MEKRFLWVVIIVQVIVLIGLYNLSYQKGFDDGYSLPKESPSQTTLPSLGGIEDSKPKELGEYVMEALKKQNE